MRKSFDQSGSSDADTVIRCETAVYAAEVSGNCPVSDLHGLDREDAALEVDHLVNMAFSQGEPVVKIIHGRGTGALRIAVHEKLEQLKQSGLVEYFRDADSPGQKGGVTFAVVVKRE